jgi:chemotaxis signal transduction protein
MGVVDVDGEVVPAIDLGQQLGQSADDGHGAFVIVGEKHQRWALAVHRVTDIVNIPEDSIEEVTDSDGSYVNAVAVHKGELISLLNLSPVFSAGFKPMEQV